MDHKLTCKAKRDDLVVIEIRSPITYQPGASGPPFDQSFRFGSVASVDDEGIVKGFRYNGQGDIVRVAKVFGFHAGHLVARDKFKNSFIGGALAACEGRNFQTLAQVRDAIAPFLKGIECPSKRRV